jgi:hypothetical protein
MVSGFVLLPETRYGSERFFEWYAVMLDPFADEKATSDKDRILKKYFH